MKNNDRGFTEKSVGVWPFMTRFLLYGGLLFMACMFIVSLVANEGKITTWSEVEQKDSLAQIREKKIKEQFSRYDGSHYPTVRHIKKLMHDESSFEHIETKHVIIPSDDEEIIVVEMAFRGTNMMGALIRQKVVYAFDISGNFLFEIED